jgi:hypothetical protein
MQQLNIEYFFPLTEQIPLELYYTDCHKPKLTLPFDLTAGKGLKITKGASNTLSNVSISGSQLNLDVEEIEFKLKDKPNLLRRICYKVMGLKWKIK